MASSFAVRNAAAASGMSQAGQTNVLWGHRVVTIVSLFVLPLLQLTFRELRRRFVGSAEATFEASSGQRRSFSLRNYTYVAGRLRLPLFLKGGGAMLQCDCVLSGMC